MEQHRRRTWERLSTISSGQTGFADGGDTRRQRRLKDKSGVGEKMQLLYSKQESLRRNYEETTMTPRMIVDVQLHANIGDSRHSSEENFP